MHGFSRGGRRGYSYQLSLSSSKLAASCLSWSRSALARYFVMRRFLKKHSIVYRMGTKASQCPPPTRYAKRRRSSRFQDFIRPMLQGPNRDLRWIINMDPTPVIFSMHPKKTLEILGKKTIVIRTSTNDTRRATIALTIMAAGDQLVPVVVYKGTENGTIKK